MSSRNNFNDGGNGLTDKQLLMAGYLFKQLLENTLVQLAEKYAEILEEESLKPYFERVYSDMKSNSIIYGIDMENITPPKNYDGYLFEHLKPIFVATAYCINAQRAFEVNKDIAWHSLSQARWYCSEAIHTLKRGEAIEETHIQTKKMMGRDAANAKHAPSKEVKKIVRELVLKHFENGEVLGPRRTFVKKIHQTIVEKARDVGHIFAGQPESQIATIEKWIREMPDLKKCFGKN